MWKVDGKTISMAENDYGVALPITINGVELNQHDSIKIVIKSEINGNAIVDKEYTNIQNNKIEFSLTENESAKLCVGVYYYVIDWFQNGEFLCNIVPQSMLKVVDKA